MLLPLCHCHRKKKHIRTARISYEFWQQQYIGIRFVPYLLCVDGSLKGGQDSSPLPPLASLAWHHGPDNRWHLSAGFEGLLIFTDMQSVRLLFRLRAREIKCSGENPFIRDSLSAAPHMEPHPSPFASYLRPISLAKTGSVCPLLGCAIAWDARARTGKVCFHKVLHLVNSSEGTIKPHLIYWRLWLINIFHLVLLIYH